MSCDVVADMVSGMVAIAGAAAAPFSGGASLLVAGGIGSVLKTALKASDCIGNEKEYKPLDIVYDTLTGFVNGLMGPLTNGIGGAAGTAVAKACGLEALESTTKAAANQAMKQAGKNVAAKGIFSKILAKQGAQYVLKEGAQKGLKTTGAKLLAYGVDMAVDGALSGASDGAIRAVAQGRFDEVLKDSVSGLIGGAIMSPVIGGSMRLATKAGGTALNKINNKLTVKNILPDGTSTKFSQGDIGDCALLSVFDGILSNDKAYKNLQKSIMTDVNGDYCVTIGGQAVKVLRDSLSDEALSDKTGVRIFEQAYKQITGDSLNGGFADVVAKNFGLNPVHIESDLITDEILEKISKQNDAILSLGLKVNPEGALDSNGAMQHYFSIKNVNMQSRVVNVVDTYDTSRTLSIPFCDIKSAGVSIDGGTIAKTDLPCSLRSELDEEFYGLLKTAKKVKEGLNFAHKAYDNSDFQSVKKFSQNFKVDNNKAKLYLLTNPDWKDYAQKRGTFDLIAELGNLKKTQAPDSEIIGTYKKIIESLGVGPTKYAQNISGDEAKLAGFLGKLSGVNVDEHEISLMKEAVRQTKTNCSFTRTPKEALSEIQQMFTKANIEKVEPLSAASIGETYLATSKKGKNYVVKMIKKGVNEESLGEEVKLLENLLPAIAKDGSEKSTTDMLNMMRNIYDSFYEELDFGMEARANRNLKKSLTRSEVASVRALSKDKRALVMDVAQGIQANKLFAVLEKYSSDKKFRAAINIMITEYKTAPNTFKPEKYTGDILVYAKMLKNYPELSNPVDVMLELPKTLTKSFSEQMMILKNIDGTTGAIMHGDPHTGNFFVNFKDGSPIIQYIDTGNTVTCDVNKIVSNLKFFMNYFTGNTDEMSEYLVNSCKSFKNNQNLSKEELIKYVSEQLKTDVFKFKSKVGEPSGQRITNFGEVYKSMQTIIENLGLTLDPDTANYQKAQGMFLDAITTTNRFTGQSFDMGLLMQDVPAAINAMRKNKVSPLELVKMIALHFAKNTEEAVGTIGQFRLDLKDKATALKIALQELQSDVV